MARVLMIPKDTAMKKILHINTVYTGGGAAQVARDIFAFAGQNGYDAYFAYGRGKKSKDEKTFRFGNGFENFLHLILVRFLGLEGFGTYFSTRKLIRFIQKEKFDLIHLHNLHGYYLNFFDLFAFLKTSGVPVVWTFQDEWPLTWLPAHSMGCLHCKGGAGKCTTNYPYPKTYCTLFRKYMLRRKKEAFGGLNHMVIVSPAAWLAREAEKSFMAKYDIVTISNTVDTVVFRPNDDKIALRKKYQLPEDKDIILFSIGNFKDMNKGIDSVLRIAELLKNKNYLFLGIGKGKLPARNNITISGYVGDKKMMAELLALSDALLFTSRAETEPVTVLEALSCGLPVAGFGIPVMHEIVSAEVGVLVPPGKEKELGQALETMLHDKEGLKRKSEHARAMAENLFSKEKILASYINKYEELLGGNLE